MTFEPTRDLALVREVMTHPECYRRMANDAAPALERFHPELVTGFEYVIARQHGEALGMFLLAGCEIHFCLLPATWGQTKGIARAFLAWVWAHTDLTHLVGPVPSYNRLALGLALSVGFHQVGARPGAVRKHGRDYDLLLLEIQRP